jgi:hypothetical protein
LLAGENEKWCAFRTEELWTTSKAALKSAPLVARIDYTNRRVASVFLTTVDDTGDWTIYDKYVIGKNAQLSSLERTIDLTGQMKVQESWIIKDRKAVKMKSVGRSISTNEVIPDGTVWLPTPAVITEPRGFPFWPLVTDRALEILSTGRACENQN